MTETTVAEAPTARRMTIAIYQCPACLRTSTDNDIEMANSQSGEDDSYLCPQCGTDEPLLNFIRTWPPVKDEENTVLEVILMAAEDRIAGRNRVSQGS